MSGAYPLPSTRSSEYLSQLRTISQLNSSQLDIQRVQAQINTGKRLSVGSDDSAAALRSLSLQRLLDLKGQQQTNLAAAKSYLDASDAAISGLATLLTQVRSTAQGVATTVASDSDRQAAQQEIQRAFEQIVAVGNRQFRGRSLFGGSKEVSQPFVITGNEVTYHGNSGQTRSYLDNNLLEATNVSGSDVFGTYTAAVAGTVNLNPTISRSTKLSDLRGGQGIDLGKISISDGTNSSTIDLSSAATLGDVVDAIVTHPPTGRTITARVLPAGISISIDAQLGTNLSVREVSGGATARELGILNIGGVGTGPLQGTDVDARLTLTTKLADILGTKSTAVIDSFGRNNNIILEARDRGSADDGVTVQFVDDSLLHAAPGLQAGAETTAYRNSPSQARAKLAFSGFNNNLVLIGGVAGTSLNNVNIQLVNGGNIGDTANVSYNSSTKTLQIAVDQNNATRVQTVLGAINSQGTFTAAYDASEPTDAGYVGSAAILSSDIGVISGNTGNSGGAAKTIFVNINPGSTTANHVLAALHSNATINAQFVSKIQEEDANAGVLNGIAPIDLNATATTAGGSGANLDQAGGLKITTGNKSYAVDISAAVTVEDLLNQLNASPAHVLAEINAEGTGLNVRSRTSGSDFSISDNGGQTATQLGLRTFSATTRLADLNYGTGVSDFAGNDFLIQRADGVEFGVDVQGAQTIGDILNLINTNAANIGASKVTARVSSVSNGIELINDNPPSGGSLQVNAIFGSNVATELGLIAKGATVSAPSTPATAASAKLSFAPANPTNTGITLSALAGGTAYNGVDVVFQNVLSGNTATATYSAGLKRLTIAIDSTATTANTVVTTIQATGIFSASLDLATNPTNNGTGLVAANGTVATTSGGKEESVVGTDPNPQEVAGLFNSLARLNDALEKNDLNAIERAITLLDKDYDRVNFARGDIGSRGQEIDSIKTQNEDQTVQLKASLSTELDTDYTSALIELTARQTAYQASLQIAAKLNQLSLLNYL